MFTHLHVRSSYTLLNSTIKIEDIIKTCIDNKMKSIALVDKNTMHANIEFYNQCINNNIKPLIGLEIDIIYNDEIINLVLLAKNNNGFQQLLYISNKINTNFKNLTYDEFLKFNQDLIIITGNNYDYLNKLLLDQNYDQLLHILNKFKSISYDFYYGVSMKDSSLFKMRYEEFYPYLNDINKVALSRIYYINKNDEKSYKALRAISSATTITDKSLDFTSGRYFRNRIEMRNIYTSDELENTNKIADSINIKLPHNIAKLAKFENKFGLDSNQFLIQLCQKGLSKRFNNKLIPNNYIERLNYELDVITKMKFEDYFLIVYDFIRYAKTQNIYVGPGRGSAPGSLVAYSLGITHIDPIKYNLLFERFLNPERISMPDIDVDFPDIKRDLVVSYVRNKYGNDNVAQIVTYSTLKAKQVIRDVAKTLSVPLREIDMLTKTIPNLNNVTLLDTYHNSTRFKELIDNNIKYQELYKICLKLEGLPRHTSIHAAGVVISNDKLDNYIPTFTGEFNFTTTQYSMDYLEKLGLIKFDMLVLKNLTIIEDVIEDINIDNFDILKIPLDDKKTFDLICSGSTIGVFQLESEGMKNLLKKMNVNNFDDIVATIALFRPGPMENIPLYLKNRSNPSNIHYINDVMKNILSSTYGVMIYQEQIMQIAQQMAGFTLGRADVMRKAISKKKNNSLESLRLEFIEGSIKNGYSKTDAVNTYELILKFANYGFNKSHSVAYGLIAYQMAYLKANFGLEFYRSLLTNAISSENKKLEYIYEARRNNIKILGPCINNSSNKYLIEDNNLRCPLQIMKGIGLPTVNIILEERNKKGKYKDYLEFIARMYVIEVSDNTIEIMIKCGALDCFNINRATMAASIGDAIQYANLIKIENLEETILEYSLVTKPVLRSTKDKPKEIMDNEKKYLDFYLGNHPITAIRNKISGSKSLIEICNINGLVQCVCQITRVKQHRTKRGDLMAFIGVCDDTTDFDIVVMPNLYSILQSSLIKDSYILVKGKKDNETSILANEIKIINIT